MKILLTLLCAFFVMSIASAAGLTSDTVTITHPTTNTDDSPLTDLVSFKIYWGTTVNGPYPNVSTIAANPTSPTVTDVLRTAPYLGRRCYVVTAVNSQGIESDYSVEICKYNRKPRPVTLSIG